MDPQQLDRGTSMQRASGLDETDTAAISDIAGRLKHAAELALIAVRSEEPERALRYLIDTCHDYRGDLQQLATKCAAAASSMAFLLS